jgi:hypothetical protein
MKIYHIIFDYLYKFNKINVSIFWGILGIAASLVREVQEHLGSPVNQTILNSCHSEWSFFCEAEKKRSEESLEDKPKSIFFKS